MTQASDLEGEHEDEDSEHLSHDKIVSLELAKEALCKVQKGVTVVAHFVGDRLHRRKCFYLQDDEISHM